MYAYLILAHSEINIRKSRLVSVMLRPLQIITKYNQSYLNIGKIAHCATLHRSDTSIKRRNNVHDDNEVIDQVM